MKKVANLFVAMMALSAKLSETPSQEDDKLVCESEQLLANMLSYVIGFFPQESQTIVPA